jgi:UDP-2,3-diacylglucosamine pyrophosphatase LpxH
MLVVVSDLHFGDGTASGNIAPRAFALFLDHVTELARRAGDAKITLLFLGDTFDLLRTEHWFYPAPGAATLDVPPPPSGEPFPFEHRPWARPEVLQDPEALSAECRDRALRIAEKVIAACRPQLDILSGRDVPEDAVGDRELRARVVAKLAPRAGPAIERIYLPGNHDRLARILPDVMERFLGALGARLPLPGELREPGLVTLAGAAVVARHGHEFDDWNFEPVLLGTRWPTADDYRRTPLGDPLTTEVLAGLPFRVRQALVATLPKPAAPGPAAIPEWIERVHAHLKGIEEVRPLGAVVRWVALSGRHVEEVPADVADVVRDTVDRTARRVFSDFFSLPFTRAWRRRRRVGAGFLSAVALRAVWLACKLVPLSLAETVLSWGFVRSLMEGDGTREAEHAQEVLARAGGEHAIFGHTHRYRQVPVRAPGGGVKVYLNSGTWRPRVHEALHQEGFRRVKEMTYLVFYEDRAPSYDTWNGTQWR